MRKHLLLGLVLAGLALTVAAPAADALHICRPNEPPWSCEHRNPTLAEVIAYILDQIPAVVVEKPLPAAGALLP